MDDQWAINEMFTEDQGVKVAIAIKRGEATGISDGSYKNKKVLRHALLRRI